MLDNTVKDWYSENQISEITSIIGNRKYGKSYCSGLICEIYQENKWPFGIVDPMGIYYTLRNQYDDIVIIGGQHADFAIDEIDDVLPGLLLTDVNFILDVSDYELDRAQEIVTEFFRFLFKWHKEYKKLRNYVIEECDFFIGQNNVMKKCKNIINQCITKGRMYGFGFTLITQRFRLIDKTAVSQSDNYVIFNMKYPLNLKLIKDLVGEDLSNDIKKLKVGQCIIYTDEGWSKYMVNQRICPHAGSTPKLNGPIEHIELKTFGLDAESLELRIS